MSQANPKTLPDTKSSEGSRVQKKRTEWQSWGDYLHSKGFKEIEKTENDGVPNK
jgi:hypothetical protein